MTKGLHCEKKNTFTLDIFEFMDFLFGLNFLHASELVNETGITYDICLIQFPQHIQYNNIHIIVYGNAITLFIIRMDINIHGSKMKLVQPAVSIDEEGLA